MALSLARAEQTVIISADSRQCFRELNVGVAKPNAEELASVHHYFINSHSIQEEVNACTFEKYALEATAMTFQDKDTVVMVGGTGLYIKAFCEGIDLIPEISPGCRDEISSAYKTQGIDWLREEVRQVDPVWFATGEQMNPQRLMRALEVKKSTGRSLREFQTRQKITRDFTIRKLAPLVSREELYMRINKRVDEMMAAGLLDEVKALYPYRHLNALRTVGYTELFNYLDGKWKLQEAVEKIKTKHKTICQASADLVSTRSRDRMDQNLNPKVSRTVPVLSLSAA